MLITFEGIDGSGKSTQTRLLKQFLINTYNKEVAVFREPGGNVLSEKIRSLLLDNSYVVQPIAELLLFSASRAQLICDQVKPLLDKGAIVILDRFYDSTTAYQGFGREVVDIAQIKNLNLIATQGIKPDVTFYLRLSLEEAEKRREGTSKDRIEKSGKEFYEKVILGFDTLAAEDTRFCTIDACLSAEVIHTLIRDKVVKMLEK